MQKSRMLSLSVFAKSAAYGQILAKPAADGQITICFIFKLILPRAARESLKSMQIDALC